MKRKHYATDLTDREWAIIEPLVPAPKPGGRPCRWDRREILNGIYYVVRSGGGWRLLPPDLPPLPTGDYYFLLLRPAGTPVTTPTPLRGQKRTPPRPPPTPPP